MSHTAEQAELLRYMALITSAQARIAGMEAENSHRVYSGHIIAYDAQAFDGVSQELEMMAGQLHVLQQKLLQA